MRLFVGACRATDKYAMTRCSDTGARMNRENNFTRERFARFFPTSS
jgi:hypothetical protein